MTGLSLPRKSWYSYVSVHLFCFVTGLAWTKNYLLRQEERHNKRKYWNIVILLMLEIIAIRRNVLRSLFVQILREHWLLSSGMWPIWILCGPTELLEGFAPMCVRGETLWKVQPLNLFSHVQKGHGKPQMALAASWTFGPGELPCWIHPISISYLWWAPVSKPTETARRLWTNATQCIDSPPLPTNWNSRKDKEWQ